MAETAPAVVECETVEPKHTEGECHKESTNNICGKGDMKETCTEKAVSVADTTEETSETTGTKRKCEEEPCSEETKKVKANDETVEAAPCPAEAVVSVTAPVTENGNGVHCDTDCKDESEATVPEEIVTKTVEDVVKLCEGGDVEASS